MKNYLDNFENIDDEKIENALDDYIIYHNNTIKSSTKFSPNEIRDLDDPNQIEIILNNMIVSFKKHLIDSNENIDRDEKMLLWNNLFLNNDIYFKNKKEEIGEYYYPCLFREYINTETIKLAFEININKEFQKKNEINCNINNLIIVPEFVYNYFIITIKNNQHLKI